MSKEQLKQEIWLDEGDQVIRADGFTDLLDAAMLRGPSHSVSARAMEGVRAKLSSRSAEMLFYDVVPSTPFGPIYIAVTQQGIAALGFDNSEQHFVARLQKRHRATIMHSPERVKEAVSQLRDYLEGRRNVFDLPLDLRSLTSFQRSVLTTIQQIPAGETISYGGLARRIGKPGSARAVGRALGSNPIPIVIPCHRVLAADGSLGGYSGRGGVATKQALLELEGAL